MNFTGLTIKQSYLETRTTSITPFMYSKIKLNLKVTNKKKLDNKKQIRALMPNLIHSLDAASLALLYTKFVKTSKDHLFYSVHDCFAVTASNIDNIKNLLASIYTELYSDYDYLKNFDKYIIETIKSCTDYKMDIEKRTVHIPIEVKDVESTKLKLKPYKIHDINWVLGDKEVGTREINKINSQYLVI